MLSSIPDEAPDETFDETFDGEADGDGAHYRDAPVSFVRRGGRMSDGQERAWEDLSARYHLDIERDEASTSIRPGSQIDLAAVYGRSAPLIVEIGSGQGHAIIHAASTRPSDDFLAVEVFRAGLARTMLDADRGALDNIRVVEANAPEVLEHLLPEGSVDELWVFFPDPWHKSKHTKRRLIAPAFLPIAARAVRDGGMLRLATDWEDYARQMRKVMLETTDFTPDFDGPWADRFEGRTMTAFERKGIAKGREIRDLAYRRVPRS